MLVFGKENIFMCLIAFQNIFWKIFSGVWKRSWKRRRKRQNPEKPEQTQKTTARSRDHDRRERYFARSRFRIAIDGAISRSFNRNRHKQCFTRSRHWMAIVGAISRSTIRVNRDLANGASRKIALRNLAFFLSLVLPLCELSLRVPSSENHLKWK